MADTTATFHQELAGGGEHKNLTENPLLHPVKLGTLLFLASEAVFFTVLIITYVYYRAQVNTAGNGPNAKDSLEIVKTGIYTVLLLASSGTIVLSERGFKHGSHAAGILWLGLTILLGATFLVGQALEYIKLVSEDITINRNLFGTTFYTLTGFHGAHVLGGLIMLTICFVLALQGSFKNGKHLVGYESVSFYWHFVDVVWVVVFSVIYIWAQFS